MPGAASPRTNTPSPAPGTPEDITLLKEIRDEHKDSEGDPHIKSKIRSKQYQAARARMMADVPQATVVVTIKGITELPLEQLKALSWHLAAVSGFTLDYSKPMPPGLERVVVSCQIHWDTMRRKKSK